MTHKALAAGITASLALAVPAPALAGDLTATSWARTGITAAQKHWHAWPTACPSITVAAADLAPGFWGEVPKVLATDASHCVIWVSKRLLPAPAYNTEFMCDLVVHEYGHLIGLEHPDDPADEGIRSSDPVMTAELQEGSVPECRPAPKPRAKRARVVKAKARTGR